MALIVAGVLHAFTGEAAAAVGGTAIYVVPSLHGSGLGFTGYWEDSNPERARKSFERTAHLVRRLDGIEPRSSLVRALVCPQAATLGECRDLRVESSDRLDRTISGSTAPRVLLLRVDEMAYVDDASAYWVLLSLDVMQPRPLSRQRSVVISFVEHWSGDRATDLGRFHASLDELSALADYALSLEWDERYDRRPNAWDELPTGRPEDRRERRIGAGVRIRGYCGVPAVPVFGYEDIATFLWYRCSDMKISPYRRL